MTKGPQDIELQVPLQSFVNRGAAARASYRFMRLDELGDVQKTFALYNLVQDVRAVGREPENMSAWRRLVVTTQRAELVLQASAAALKRATVR